MTPEGILDPPQSLAVFTAVRYLLIKHPALVLFWFLTKLTIKVNFGYDMLFEYVG